MSKDLVSIVMLSFNGGRCVEESVRSVLAQTYQDWELLFVAEKYDEALTKALCLRKEVSDRMKEDGEEWTVYSAVNNKIKVSYLVGESDVTPRRNSALKEASGRWIAFLDVGDVWEPTKLEKQIKFMEENGYAFSYTQYGLMNRYSKNMGVTVSGKEHVNHEDMLKCCWPAYLTVMYDVEKVGLVKVKAVKENNDYALWLNISVKHDLHLLPENLATMRTPYGRFSRFIRTDRFKWRYEVYRKEENYGPVASFFYTLRNGWYGLVKWFNYVKKE